jgi:hypothetical protein
LTTTLKVSIFTYSVSAITRIDKTNVNQLQSAQNKAIRSMYRSEWCNPMIRELSGLSLLKDKVANLKKKHIAVAEGRSDFIELLIPIGIQCCETNY